MRVAAGASANAPQMLAQTARTGRAVAFIEMPRPAMILVASPVSDALAIVLTGLKVRARVVLGDDNHGRSQCARPISAE